MAKRERCKAERKWRNAKLTIFKDLYRQTKHKVCYFICNFTKEMQNIRLLFLTHYGSIIYFIYIWKKGRISNLEPPFRIVFDNYNNILLNKTLSNSVYFWAYLLNEDDIDSALRRMMATVICYYYY